MTGRRFAAACCPMIASVLGLVPSAARAGEPLGVVAVHASVSPAYTRAKLPDGSVKPGTYAFGEGGRWGGSRRDSTIDRLCFLDVARAIAPTLAARRDLASDSKDPRRADLLIMVYWGTTAGTNDGGGASSSPLYQSAQGVTGPAAAAVPPAASQ